MDKSESRKLKPPFPEQKQEAPGLESEINPRPNFQAPNYKAAGFSPQRRIQVMSAARLSRKRADTPLTEGEKMHHLNHSISLWTDTVRMPRFAQLTESLRVDVCVVGGGIAGLTTAYLLSKAGKTVCVLEGNRIGHGQTGQTTAHFTTALDDRYFTIESLFGKKNAILAAESHLAAVQKAEEIINREQIKCEMEKLSGFLFRSPQDNPDIVFRENDAIHDHGVLKAHLVPRAPIESFDTGVCIEFPNQMSLHPLKYLRGLAQATALHGGKIFELSRASEVHEGHSPYVKTSDQHVVRCDSIVVATNSPINNLFAIHTKQAPYRTYVVGILIQRSSVAKALYWDTADPYHYVRIHPYSPDHDILIVGGEDHKTGQEEFPESRFYRLIEWASERFPTTKKVAYRWSGQVMEPIDSLAFLGRNPVDSPNCYVITGDSGNGMTHCTIGAMLVTDQILGIKNPWEELYNPARINLRATKSFLSENVNVAKQYSEWLGVTSEKSIQNLQRDSGIVINKGLRKVAVYKDELGQLKFMSARCTHLNGVVHWNSVEKSWDCPCHGSRFDCNGVVIEGPALKSLAQQQTTEMAVEAEMENKKERAI